MLGKKLTQNYDINIRMECVRDEGKKNVYLIDASLKVR